MTANVGGSGAGIVRFDSRANLDAVLDGLTLGPDNTTLVQQYVEPEGGAIVPPIRRLHRTGGRPHRIVCPEHHLLSVASRLPPAERWCDDERQFSSGSYPGVDMDFLGTWRPRTRRPAARKLTTRCGATSWWQGSPHGLGEKPPGGWPRAGG